MDLRQYMQSKGWQWKEVQRPKGLTAILNCPFCEDSERKFAISLTDGSFNCMHLNNCGRKGSWWDLQRELGDKPQLLDSNNYILSQPMKYEKPKVQLQLPDKAREYLKTRKLSDKVIDKFQIKQVNGDIAFPYYKDNELVNVKYRSIKEKKFRQEKNAEPTLFGRDLLSGDMVILTEGEIDALSYYEYGLKAVSVPWGAGNLQWIENEWNYLQQFQKIYISFDNDEAGQKKIDEIVNRLGRWRCYSITLPYKDCNECLMNGVEQKYIVDAITEAKSFDPSSLMRAKDFEDEINFMFEHPEKMHGIETPYNGLTDILKGWREAEMTIWSGRSGSGKSTILNDVIYSLLKKGEKVMMGSFEMLPRKYLKWMTVRIKEKYHLNRVEVGEALEELQNLFIINLIGNIIPSDLLNVLDFAARKYGVKHFFIDSLMKINLPGYDKFEAQKDFCNLLIDNVAKMYEGHVHLVAHPRKGFKDTDRPDKMDVSGSSDITNLADNVIIIYRLSQEEKDKILEKGSTPADSIVYVKKNREWGNEGDINLSFDSNTKKFTEILKI
jgi:twinkle protein